MIAYRNIRRYDNLEFSKYTELRGYSHSFLKTEVFGNTPEFKETDKVIVGRLVDSILTDPGKADMLHLLYPIARSIAQKIKTAFGVFIKRFETQISYTAEMVFEAHVLHTTGRIDFLLPGHAVIDLKVTHAKDVHGLIKFMGYENQLWNYANLAGVKKKYIMIHSVPLKETFMIDLGIVSPRSEFWEAKILKFGLPAIAA